MKKFDHRIWERLGIETDDDMMTVFQSLEAYLAAKGIIETSDIVGILDYR